MRRTKRTFMKPKRQSLWNGRRAHTSFNSPKNDNLRKKIKTGSEQDKEVMDSRQRLRYRWRSFSRAETGFVKTFGQRLPSMDSSRFAKQPRTRAPASCRRSSRHCCD